MKTRVLIIEPSEVIVEGLSSLLDAQTRFKVLPPLHGLEGLTERLITGKFACAPGQRQYAADLQRMTVCSLHARRSLV